MPSSIVSSYSALRVLDLMICLGWPWVCDTTVSSSIVFVLLCLTCSGLDYLPRGGFGVCDKIDTSFIVCVLLSPTCSRFDELPRAA